jgi:protocatechuate 3,4-dioxygenase beta subunit
VSFSFHRAFVLVAFLCGFSLAGFPQAPADTPPPLIEGSVLNKVTGSPVKHAHVMYVKVTQVAGEGTFPISTDTDADGQFSIQVEPGAYRLWVERAGFARMAYGSSTPDGAGTVLNIAPGQQMREIKLRIVPLGAISGRVFDEEGDPVQGAGIQVLRFSYANGRRQLIPVSGASTNDRGEYRAYSLPAGRYFLLATLRGSPLSHPPESSALIPEMQEPYAPVYYPGVMDFPSAVELSLPEGGEITDADFHLQRIRGITVHGRLISPAPDLASSQVQVVLAHAEGNAASFINRASATFDRATGRFEFHGVAPGSYILVGAQVAAGQPLSGRVALEVNAATQQQSIPLSLTPAFEITGSIQLESGSAPKLPNVTLRLASAEGLAPGPQPSSKIAADGSIRLSGVTPGMWTFTLDPLPEGLWIKSATFGEFDVLRGELNVSAGTRAQLHILLAGNGAQVAGRVVQDGQPHHATVVLVPSAPELQSSAQMYRTATTNEQGEYSFTGVRPGAYKLFAFEEIEPLSWMDPELVKPVESFAETVSVSEGEHATRQLAPIPPDALLPSR